MTRPVIYIAGPITKGDRNRNLYAFHYAHRWLIDHGFAPINPGMTMQLPFAWEPQYTHEMWLECCFPLVERVDAVLRLEGESAGADAEVDHALKCDIPVYKYYHDLLNWKHNEYQSRNDAARKNRDSWNRFARWLLSGSNPTNAPDNTKGS